jgi:hypothetical protein
MVNKEVSSSFITFLSCGIIQRYIERKENVEEVLHKIGIEIGYRLVEQEKVPRSNRIISLLYNLTFTFLPSLYKSSRKIEKSNDRAHTYLLSEDTPLFGRYVSVPKESIGFSADAIVCGVVESYLLASGFRSSVCAYGMATERCPSKIVYLIKFNEEDVEREEKYRR